MLLTGHTYMPKMIAFGLQVKCVPPGLAGYTDDPALTDAAP